MKNNLKLLFLTIMLVLGIDGVSFAGLKWVDVGVNGLTCSMCTRSVEMSLQKLFFVDSVIMSLENTEGRVYFKPGVPIDMNQVSKAVTDAGFSVRFVKMNINFDEIELKEDGTFVLDGQMFQWLDPPVKMKGSLTVQLVSENFLPKKQRTEWKKNFTPQRKPDQRALHVVQQL